VEDENSVLLDLTPFLASRRYPFIKHNGVWQNNLLVRNENEKAGLLYEHLGYETNR
jgi:hypothetical protein